MIKLDFSKNKKYGFVIWCVILAVAVIVAALKPQWIPFYSGTKGFCILIFLLIDFLHLCILLNGRIDWLNNPEEKQHRKKTGGRKTAFILLVACLLITAIYIYYCQGIYWFYNSSGINDALTAGGLLYIYVLITRYYCG